MKKGFTLVELSIVLVIIGLLIGGILVAQSMIDSVKAQSFIRQIGQINIAASNFKTKYNYLPGDSPFHSAAGDGDNKLEDSNINSGSTTYVRDFNYEFSNFWVHLQQDGFLAKEYSTLSADASSGIVVGTHIPSASGASSKNAGILPYYHSFYSYGKYKYIFCDWSTTTTELIWTSWGNQSPIFTPMQAFSIDVKMDDGITGFATSPNVYSYTGNVLGYGPTGADTCYSSSANNTYLTNSDIGCCMMVNMFIQTGQTQ